MTDYPDLAASAMLVAAMVALAFMALCGLARLCEILIGEADE